MDKFQEELDRIISCLSASGITIVGKKDINFAVQLKISKGGNSAFLNVYHGKRGVVFVVQGGDESFKNKVKNIIAQNVTLHSVKVQDTKPKSDAAKSKKSKKIEAPTASNRPPGLEKVPDFDGKWIGIDESGKGDFFGPLVVAAVMLDEETALALENLGIRDSKALSDQKNSQLAAEIRRLCHGRYAELKLYPKEYNELYDNYNKQGKNLNHLLGYAHAYVLEELLKKEDCHFAIADQFGAEKFTREELFAKGQAITLLQMPRGERNSAVAAASILARDSFLLVLSELSAQVGLNLPKGATTVLSAARQLALQRGREALAQVCKLHFKTYDQIFE